MCNSVNVVRPSFPMMMISWLVGPGCGCGGGSSVQFWPAAPFHTRVGVWVYRSGWGAGCRVTSSLALVYFKRKVREAIEIKTLQPTINRDQGFDLPAIYSEILPVSVTRDRSRQTSGHPAKTIGAVASSSQTKETWRLRKLAFTSNKDSWKVTTFPHFNIF